MTDNPEFEKFDTAVKKLVSVSHDELKRRDAEWQKRRRLVAKKERQKSMRRRTPNR